MSRLLVFIFLFSTTYSLTAQTSPYGLALDTLAQWVEESPSYFADLPQRAADPNAELETEEYLLLYYSSAYLEGYSPYGEKIAVSAVYDLMEQDDYEGAIAMTQGMLQEQPACARYHRLMGIAYDALGDTSNANIYFDRYVNLISVPFYSGTGSRPTALLWCVV
jgi:Flp pilus assembly protein TadD